jgi:regulatory protein
MTGSAASEGTVERALGLAYSYLGRRERTERELREYLENKDITPAIADLAVAELVELGYIDDARYARLFAADKRALDGWGADRIARALGERGLARELIELALEEQGREGELEQALALLQRRCPEPPVDRRGRDRALGILLRKGYESELALEALQLHAGSSQARTLR